MDFKTSRSTPSASTSSSQPEYPLVTSARLQSWSVTDCDSAGGLVHPPLDSSLATAAHTGLPMVTYASGSVKAAHQGKGFTDIVGEQLLPKPAISNARSAPATEAAMEASDLKGGTSPKPKKTLRLSYNDELRLAAKQTREKSGRRNTVFDRAKGIMKRRRLRQSAVSPREPRPDMFILSRRDFPGASLNLTSQRQPEDPVRETVANVTLTDLAESRNSWFQGRQAAGDPTTTEKGAAPEDETPSPGDNVNAGSTLLPRVQEHLLYPLAFLLLIVIMAVLIMLFASKSVPRATGVERKRAMYDSETCYQDAAFLSELLSWDIDDPCENFQPFVCRRWSSQFDDVPLTQSVSSDDVYVSSVEHVVQAFHRKPPVYPTDTVPLRMLLDKCANVKQIEDDGWSVFLDFMFNMTLEGFPLTPPVRNRLNVWETAATLLRKTGTAALLRLSVASDLHDASHDVPLLMPPDTLAASGVEVDEAVRMYTAAVLAAIKCLNKDFVPLAHTRKTVEFARALEMLSASSPPEAYTETSFGYAQPEMVEFLSAIISDVPSITLAKDSPNVWLQASGIVSQVLKLVRSTEPYIVINFLCVRLMVQVSPFLPPSKALSDFYATLAYGKVRTDVPRWQLCLRSSEKALLPLFYKSLLTVLDLRHDLTAFRFRTLVGNIASGFLSGVDNSPLFDEAAKAAIRALVPEIKLEVLAPASVKEASLFATYVDKLSVSKATAFETYAELHEQTFLATLSHGSSGRWTRSAFSTTCWYERNPNIIYVPALVFNVTLPAREEPMQLTRAAPRVASCIFDALLVEANNIDSSSWFNQETRSRLRNTSRCLNVQKSRPSMALIRDALSTQFAFDNFQHSVKQHNKSLSVRLLQGKVLTSAQLFFVHLMLQRCKKKGDLDTQSHSSAHDLNTVLSNDRNFAAAFNCSPGSPMNSQKCHVSRVQ
ncbi:hypothetical protein V5799_008418 [Amblyomma americanum]|uniref:Peptidase M13 N-terminal domain-containing protein n=1 Tax=Amblyomma americanum TaxID=6943 RepID=A0AAQ4FES5_AMBAM